METNTPNPIKEWAYSVLIWLIIMYTYYFLAIYGVSDYIREGVINNYITSWMAHLELTLMGVLFGFLFGVINTFTERSSIRKKSFGKIILIKSSLYIMSLIAIGLIIGFVYWVFEILEPNTFNQLWEFYSTKFLVSYLLFFSFALIFVNIAIQINKKFGPGNFMKLLLGKYQTPKEENRIFMFLDLHGSTTIAEELGHKTYSQLLRNCFHDLTEYVIRYKAEIYQYVGDEVVLTWNYRNGLENLNCIKLFFAYRNKLQTSADYYIETFGMAPHFKCGIDMGSITATEIGDLKREIAFHGDVLNTAARIQEQCNKFERDILLSEHLITSIDKMTDIKTELISDLPLRGKQTKIKIYSAEMV